MRPRSRLGTWLLSLSGAAKQGPRFVRGTGFTTSPTIWLRDVAYVAPYGRIIEVQKLSIQALSCASASASVLAALITIYWLLRMQRRFRHKLILLLILGDLLKATWYLIFASISIAIGTIPTKSALCQVSGWCIQVGIEISDYSVLAIAVHSGMQMFHSHKGFKRDGLASYCYYVYTVILAMPIIMASLAFTVGNKAYLSQGAFCSLPIRPLWHRLVLAWIPRYLIAIIIVGIALAVYSHVDIQLTEFASTQESLSRTASLLMETSEKLTTPLTAMRAASIAIGKEYQTSRAASIVGFARSSHASSSHDGTPNAEATGALSVASPSLLGTGLEYETKEKVLPARSDDLPVSPPTPIARSCPIASTTPPSSRRPSVAFSVARSSHSVQRSSVACFTAEGSLSNPDFEGTGGSSTPPPESVPNDIPNPLTARRVPAEGDYTERTLDDRRSEVDDDRPDRKYRRRMPNSKCTYGAPDRKRLETRRKVRHTFIYPVVYVLMWTTPAIYQIYTYNSRYAVSPPFVLALLNTLCISSMGLIDCIVFCLRERPWRTVPGSTSPIPSKFSALVTRPRKAPACSGEQAQAHVDVERLGNGEPSDLKILCGLPCRLRTCDVRRSEEEMAARELALARLHSEMQDRRAALAMNPELRTRTFPHNDLDMDGIDSDDWEDIAPDDGRPTLATMLREISA